MAFLFFVFMMPLPYYIGHINDPLSGIFHTKSDTRNQECIHMTQAQAHARYPGLVDQPPARALSLETDALVCTQRYLSQGERLGRDEAVLSTLQETTAEIAQRTSTLFPGDRTWFVDVFYPEPRVAAKVTVATKVQLVERGRHVSDSVPILAAGDIEVLARMPPQKAYPLACARYFSERSLAKDDIFLGVMLLDARETQLHAGVCQQGGWTWMQ